MRIKTYLSMLVALVLLLSTGATALAADYTIVFGGVGPGGGTYSLGQPLSTGYSAVTSKWNQPRNVTSGTNPHRGVDVTAAMNTNVLAVCDGWILSQDDGTENYLEFMCDRNGDNTKNDDLKIYYDHVEEVGFVANNVKVTKGTKIAESGDEDGAYDPHLHFGAKAVRTGTTEVWMRNEPYYRSVSAWNYGKDLDFISNVSWNAGDTISVSSYVMNNGTPSDVTAVAFHRANGTSTWTSSTMTKSGTGKSAVFTFDLGNTYSTGTVVNVMVRATRPGLTVYDDAFMIPKYAQPAENPNSTANKYDYFSCTIGQTACTAVVTS
ncbi:hypothetical protein J19TS2_60340 [Cohnella xylanilytica]|uniref:M23 family metallopeptidase n=1 Tax=Cohnella xylanilytica TaxID=557555 RepID=UPI001B0DCA12|nr:M23 family metallopeptidase [Cohnella xylanilytica]GIO16479.1 hypothetical protein J19TS2_60340 [Cohnella xylanilytica]